MKILFVTSEAGPFAASGGLGDVMGALPSAIAEASPETEVSVILPLYDTVKEQYRCEMEKVADIFFRYAWRSTGASVFRIRRGTVSYLFVENRDYFNRGRLYGEYDDAERFAFFCRAVTEYIIQSGDVPDILHANDWQAALTVIYAKTRFAAMPQFAGMKTVFTIHNIEYQGKYDPAILGDIFDLDECFRSVVDFDGCVNLMKGAVTVADRVTTVSPNYANELHHDFFAFGLAGVIAGAHDKMSGIINGIDYGYFSPEKGGDIVKSYTTRSLKSGKAANKLALQAELGLPQSADTPLYVMITRLTSGKGIDLVLPILDEFLMQDVQFVVLGTGDSIYENAFRSVESRHPDKMRALIAFDRVLSKKMYASADFFVMPSKSEPCGLAQMIACSYGTIPVVRAVGGLYDSIKPYGGENANGFVFNNFNAHELLFTLKHSLDVFRDPTAFSALRTAAKKSDFSWKNSAEKYMDMYHNLKN